MKKVSNFIVLLLLFAACGQKNEPALGPTLASKIIIGADDREVLSQMTGNERRMGLLLADDESGKVSICSGTLIGERYVLSAAHCVYDHRGVKKNLAFMPGALPDYKWSHRYRVSKVYIHRDYLSYEASDSGLISLEQARFDLALIELEDLGSENAGNVHGFYSYWGKLQLEDSAIVSTIGYPGDKPLGTPIRISSCFIHKKNSNLFESDCDAVGGQSGSGIIINDSQYQKTILRGVVSSSGAHTNYVVMLTGMHQAALVAIQKGGGQGIFTAMNAPREGVKDSVLVLHNKCAQDLLFAINAQFSLGKREVKAYYRVKGQERSLVGTIYGANLLYYARNDSGTITYAGEWFRDQAVSGMNGQGYRYVELDESKGIKEVSLVCN